LIDAEIDTRATPGVVHFGSRHLRGGRSPFPGFPLISAVKPGDCRTGFACFRSRICVKDRTSSFRRQRRVAARRVAGLSTEPCAPNPATAFGNSAS
jgi:hypothetical protein